MQFLLAGYSQLYMETMARAQSENLSMNNGHDDYTFARRVWQADNLLPAWREHVGVAECTAGL
eukprot:SAG31_NODE_17983_length_650_cov_83.096189_1_plen_62_part_10